MNIYDTVVIGAGPSGLSFCTTYTGKYLLVEMGKHINERDHNNDKESLVGVGGAGLFSDGKYSFYPAGTKVWDLYNIENAYDNLTKDLKKYIEYIPKFTKKIESLQENYDVEEWKLKKYPCYYIPLKDRIKFINDMCEKLDSSSTLYQHQVIECKKNINDNIYLVTIKNLINNTIFTVKTKSIICAGGRFFPLFMGKLNKKELRTKYTKKIFRRIEYGVRIVSSKENKFMKKANKDLLDPKFIKECDGIEYRTFCWCLDAEIVLTNHLGIKTYSGRADCEPTGNSNFGFNVRIKKNNNNDDYIKKLIDIKPFELPIDKIDELVNYYGNKMGKLLIDGLESLINKNPDLKHNTKVVGPTIEGVGYYPDIDENLKVIDENIYCIGDNSGIFRGIIPSMLSGYWLANHLK